MRSLSLGCCSLTPRKEIPTPKIKLHQELTTTEAHSKKLGTGKQAKSLGGYYLKIGNVVRNVWEVSVIRKETFKIWNHFLVKIQGMTIHSTGH